MRVVEDLRWGVMKDYTRVCGVWGDGIGWMGPDGVRWGGCVWDDGVDWDWGWVGWVGRMGGWVGSVSGGRVRMAE